MNRLRRSLLAAGFGGLAGQAWAIAPQGKNLTIGLLYVTSARDVAAFREYFIPAMKQRGYVEGRNLQLEWRFADNRAERLDGLAAELVAKRVDVIIAGGTPPTLSARKATTTIPILSIGGNSPVNLGLATSLARPGGNVSGITLMGGTIAKGVEVLKTLVPRAKRVGWFMNPDNPSSQRSPGQLAQEGKEHGLELIAIPYREPADLERELGGTRRTRVDAIYLRLDSKLNADSDKIGAFSHENRIPGVGSHRRFVPAGGLASFGQSYDEMYRMIVEYVDKIANGASVAELPIIQPTKFELCLNQKAAKSLGITIPQDLLLRADLVVD